MNTSIRNANLAVEASATLLSRGTEAWLKVVEAYGLCDQLLTERLAKVGVPIAEHDVLMALLRNPGATQQHIAKSCFVAKSGVSMLLVKLEAAGMVRREADKTDGRIKRAYLSTKGEKLAIKTLKIQQEVVELMAKPLSDTDLKHIATVMESVSTRLKAAKTR
jgi:DNA-binding MarR family transcriptional regulator